MSSLPKIMPLTSSGKGVLVKRSKRKSWNWLTRDQIAAIDERFKIDTPITAPELRPEAA